MSLCGDQIFALYEEGNDSILMLVEFGSTATDTLPRNSHLPWLDAGPATKKIAFIYWRDLRHGEHSKRLYNIFQSYRLFFECTDSINLTDISLT